jgi:hypothetical protein
VLPDQGHSPGSLVCSRASSRRHGAATSSARACRLGYVTLSAGRGFSPAPVATACVTARRAATAVAAARGCPARPGRLRRPPKKITPLKRAARAMLGAR